MEVYMEEGCRDFPLVQRAEEDIIKQLHHRGAQLVRLARCAVTGLYLLLATGIVLTLCIFFGYLRNATSGQHAPGYDDQISEPKAEMLRQQRESHVAYPSAHLTVLRSGNSSEFLEWEQAKGDANIEGFTYQDGALIVPRDGYYKIYLHITYDVYGDESLCVADSLILFNTVYRRQEGYRDDVALIRSYDTVDCNKNVSRKSIYAAAEVRLKKDDKLKVRSSAPGLVTRSEKEVFFGAHFQHP